MHLLLPVFQLLYFVAHFLVSLLQAVYDSYTDVRHTLVFVYHKLSCSATLHIEEVNGKGKVPQHLAIIFLPGKYSPAGLPQLVRVLAAFAESGVHYLTAYDPAGKLEEQQEDLVTQLQESLPGCCIVLLQAPQGGREPAPSEQHPDARCRKQRPQCDGGDAATQKTTIYLSVVSCDSWTSHLVACVQQLSSKSCSDLAALTIDDLSSALAMRQLQDLPSSRNGFGFLGPGHKDGAIESANPLIQCKEELRAEGRCIKLPDPDLAVVVGDYTSSGGFSPWQLRLTEFMLFPCLGRLTTSELGALVSSYAKIEQRYGR